MATRYAIRHVGTKAFLTIRPSLYAGVHTSLDEADACSFKTKTEATLEVLDLGEFASAYDVVPVEVPMSEDEVSVEVRERTRREAGEFRA